MSYSRGSIIKSFLWKLFERSSTQLIQFVVTIVLARLLLPSEYGTIALIAIFIQLCDVIVDGGLNTALIQKKNADNVDFSTIFFFSLGLSGLMYGILFWGAYSIALFYRQPNLVPIIRVLGLSLPFSAFNSIQRAYVSRNMLFQRLFYSSFGGVFISGLLGILLALRGFGVWALVAQSVINQVFTTVIMWFTVRWRPRFCFSTNRLKVLFSYGWKILGANFITTVFVNIRKLVIGKYFSAASLAYYEKGDQLPSLVMNNVFSSVQTILLPAFSDVQDDRLRVKQMMRRSTKLSCFFIYPLMAGMIVSAKPLVVLLLTEKWLSVVPFVQILCIANFFRPITLSNWEAIKALGYSDITLKLEIVKKIVDVLILVVSVIFGVYAIAWGCVLFNFVCVFINLAPNKKLLDYGVKEQAKDALPTLLIALIMGGGIYGIQLLPIPNIMVLLLQIFFGVILYAGLCLLFKEESMMYILQVAKEHGFVVKHDKCR